MRTIVILTLLAFASTTWISYDSSVTSRDRTNIYFNCLYSSGHFFAVYQNIYWDNMRALVQVIASFLKDNAIFVLLSPYVNDSTDLANYDALWTWLGAAISAKGCSLDLLYYLIDSVISSIWSRIEVDQFLDLLWSNLNLYSTVDKFYFDEFWSSCPFTYWELYQNFIKPHLG